ncbi:MAG: 50S ribosomal protein L13 [Sedimentisphaerales bacterium]|nr:50S ribosomal protein L13 [Sedimentisphaerales bacterium]
MQAKLQKSTIAKKETVTQNWYLASAENQILGRFASQIAMILMGKHRPGYTPHVDTGDYVVVTNAEKIRITGKKALTKQYDYYTNYAGGHKYVTYAELMKKKPEKVIMEAVRRMLPKSKLGRKMFSKLKVYRGGAHPHEAQPLQALEIKGK